MCGVYGYISKKRVTKKQQEKRNGILKGLAIGMETRGKDSSGIGFLTKKVAGTYKDICDSSTLIKRSEFEGILKQNPHIVVGHTRFKTTGDITPKNAHPFRYGNIIGVHNGVISNWKDLDGSVSVDSEVIFKRLDMLKNNYHKAFKKIQGSAVVTWFDTSNPEQVHLVAHENPLSFVRIPELATIFWASEIEYLKAVCEAVVQGTEKHYYEATEERVYTINQKLKIQKTDIKFKESYRYTGGYYSSGNQWNSYKSEKKDDEQLFLDSGENDILGDFDLCAICQVSFTKTSAIFYDYAQYQTVCEACSKYLDKEKLEQISVTEYKKYYAWD